MNNHNCTPGLPLRNLVGCRPAAFFLLFFGLFSVQLAAQSPLPPLPTLDSLPETQILEITRQMQATAAGQRDAAGLELHTVQTQRSSEEATLATLKADTLSPKDQLTSHEKSLKAAKSAEKTAQKNFKQTEKTVALLESVTTMDSLARRKALPKAQRQLNDMQAILYPPPPKVDTPAPNPEPVAVDTASPVPAVATTPAKKDKKPEAPVKKYKNYDPATDVMLHPPVPPCVMAMDRRDEFSGEVQRETARAELFRFTNPMLKTYLDGKVHILCESALSATGQNTILLLTFTIRDPNVRKAFGNLPKASIATLQMLDGTTFTVNNQQMSEAQPDDSGQVFTFLGRYPLDRTVTKKLRTTGLDKLRIAWSTGYEDYEVQNVDLLARQLQCLEQ